jgi:hypothetical protein
MGEKDLMGYRLGIAMLMFFLSAAVIPASAGVTKTTVESVTDLQVPTEVSPDIVAICENRFTDTNTLWWKDAGVLRQDIDERITGTCDGGISFACASQVIVNSQDTAASTGICRFSSSGGGKWQRLFHWTAAKGEGRAEFSKWN